MSRDLHDLHGQAARTIVSYFVTQHRRLPTVAECDLIGDVTAEAHDRLYDPMSLKTALRAERAQRVAGLPFDPD